MPIPFCPHSPTVRQQVFLDSRINAHFESLYGGQASGGKSDALLMAALQYVDRPAYASLLLRRTFADLNKPGALMDRAAEWLQPTSARWQDRAKAWRFPSGAVVAFGYMDSEADRFQYQGAEYQFVGFDELTQFTETQYLYLASRLRRLAAADVPLRLRSATNPGGIGHVWVKRRFVEPGSRDRPFVRARATDNPHVDQAAYARSLSTLDRVTHAQLAEGLWVQDDSQRVYHYSESTDVATLPSLLHGEWRHILAVDLGASTRDPTTAFDRLVWHPHHDTTYVISATTEAGIIPSTLAERVTAFMADHADGLVVIDEGALGHGYGGELRQRYGLPVIAAEKRDKAGARRLINGALEQGKLRLLADGCDVLRAELGSLVYGKSGMDVAENQADHASDALLYGWRLSEAHRATAAPREIPYGTPEYWEEHARKAAERELDRARNPPKDGFAKW